MGYAEDMGVSVQEAEEVFSQYFKALPKFKSMIEQAHAELERDGYIKIPGSGGHRNIKEIWSRDYGSKQQALRQALNTKIQGGSGHLSRTALILIQETFDKYKIDAKLVVTVHDSFVVSCKKEDARKVSDLMQYIMENLPLPMFDVVIDGVQQKFKLEAEPTVTTNYNFELFMTDDFEEFSSIDSYYYYYRTLQIYDDELEQGIISEDEHKRLSDIWERDNYGFLKTHNVSDRL